MKDRLLKVESAAKWIGVSVRTLKRRVASGKIKPVIFGVRRQTHFYLLSDLKKIK